MLLKKKGQLCVWVLAVALMQTPAMAQEGTLKDKVIAALNAVADGTCPEKLMNFVLIDPCEQQIEVMQQALQRRGSIKDAQYRGIEQLPNGIEAEVYRVVFSRGNMTWMAAAGPNGKLSVLWSPSSN